MLVVMDDAVVDSVLELHLDRRSVREIATELGVPKSTVQRIIAAALEDTGDDEWEPPPVDDEADAAYMRELIAEAFTADGALNKDSLLCKLLFNVDLDRLARLGRAW